MDFLRQYQELIKKSPMILNHGLKNENAEYTDYVYRSKNVYFGFDGGHLWDCAYVFNSGDCTDCFDLSFCFNCELCCQCVDCVRCYNCGYCQDCRRSSNLLFCYGCRHCSDLFGCTGLTHKKYCIFNKQLTKKEYQKQKAKLIKQPPGVHLSRLEELKRILPKPLNRNTKSENCDCANRVYSSNNLYWCFDSRQCQDSFYLDDLELSRDCVDCTQGHECELCYECNDLGHSFNCSFINNGDHLRDCHFCTHCYKSEHLSGCVNLSHAKYCILNKQYSESEYFAKVKEIRKELGWPEPTQTQIKRSKRGWWKK